MSKYVHKDPTNRTRRAIFVFGSTLLFAAIPSSILYFGLEGPIAEKATDGFIGLIEMIIIGYLFTTTVDRSEILTNVGVAMRERVHVVTPEELKTNKRKEIEEDTDEEEEPVG